MAENIRESATDDSELFRILVESLPFCAIFRVDREGFIQSWNAGAERLTGYTAAEIVGQPISVFFALPDQQAGRSELAIQAALAVGEFQEDVQVIRKNGSCFSGQLVLKALCDAKGQVASFAVVVRNLGEGAVARSRPAEIQPPIEAQDANSPSELAILVQERRRDELCLRTILASISAVIWRWDIARDNFSFLPTWYEYTGMSEQEVEGWRWVNAIHPDDRDLVEKLFREAIRTHADFSTEYRVRRGGGEYRHISVKGMPLRDDQDMLVEWVGICIDITDRKNLESQLQHSQKLEAVGQLAGGVAHDFNNLLTIILGFGEVLQLSDLSEQAAAMVKAIMDAGQRAAGLTRQLLAISRRSLLEMRVIDVNAVVSQTESMLRRLIGEDIAFETILDPSIGRVRADAGLLGQVLLNLVVNARDAMPRGGRLTIETKNVLLKDRLVNSQVEVDSGPYVLLSVSDTGCGMSPEVRSRVFEPFFTTKPLGKGTGLGLSVVHDIVKQFHGKIGAYTEPGVGSLFKIYLPVVAPEIIADETTKKNASTSCGHETIIVVDDEAGVREIAGMALRAEGFNVLTAKDSIEARKLASAAGPNIDLLVTDVVMPGMSGRELADSLRIDFPSMAVIFFSGYTDDAVALHGLTQAEVEFIQKPFTPRSLSKKVHEVLDKRPTLKPT